MGYLRVHFAHTFKSLQESDHSDESGKGHKVLKSWVGDFSQHAAWY